MLVARTDQDVPKHKGLTYFLMDMEQEGVQVRPLRQITGEAEFNELFLEEARIPAENVVGGEGNGWNVAITTLAHERAGLAFASAVAVRRSLNDLIALCHERGATEDPVIRQRLAQLHIETENLRLNALRGLSSQMRTGVPGPGGLAAQVAVVGHQPGADRAGDRGARRGRAAIRTPSGPTASCARGPTRSRAAPPRSSRTSSPSGCSAFRKEGGSDMQFRLHRRPADDQAHRARAARRAAASRERLRELAEMRASIDDRSPSPSSSSSAGRGSPIAEEHGGQGLGLVELVILQEQLGYALAPLPFLSTVAAALVLEHAG